MHSDWAHLFRSAIYSSTIFILQTHTHTHTNPQNKHRAGRRGPRSTSRLHNSANLPAIVIAELRVEHLSLSAHFSACMLAHGELTAKRLQFAFKELNKSQNVNYIRARTRETGRTREDSSTTYGTSEKDSGVAEASRSSRERSR